VPDAKIMENSVGRASLPATFGGTGFQPLGTTAMMPVHQELFNEQAALT
jgi:hypothetical protein